MSSPADGAPVLVTGATSGIGLAIASRLERDGLRVFAGVLPGEDTAELEQLDVTPVSLDVTERASIEAARAEIEKHLGDLPLFGLVNNAGTLGAGAVEVLDLDEVRRVHEVNVVGLLAVTQAFLPALRAARGRIINLGSLSGLVALPFLGPYTASKFAVEAWSDVLRRELLPFGVDVTVVQPGSIRTPLWSKAADMDLSAHADSPYEDAVRRVWKRVVKKGAKGMPPARVADAVAAVIRAERPPTRIRIQKRRKGRLKYALLPFAPDRLIDRMVAKRVWK